MVNPTTALLKQASTHHGMRRILKRRLPVPRYIELAVKAGTYKTPSIRPNYLGLHDDPAKLNQLGSRQRDEQRVKLGRGILDYPEEYEILSMNPPLPLPPRTPVRVRKMITADKKKRAMQKKKEKKKLELLGMVQKEDDEWKELPGMDELVKAYLRRHEERVNTGNITASKREQEYYSNLLLGKTIDMKENTAMGRKSQLIENAYAFALRQQQVLLQGDVKGMQDSAAKVEELLKMEASSSRKEGHEITKEIKEWREDNKEEDLSKENANTDSLPSILHSKPRSIRALSIWSARLRSIPYNRWSIGATTALDHWIAREVLGMDENTWNIILEGGGADVSKLNVIDGETRGGIAGRMRDVVMTRESLFPETIVGANDAAELAGDLESELEDETNKSINALLASLGSFDDDMDDEFKFDDDVEKERKDEEDKVPVEAIMNELQEWRKKNAENGYANWDGGLKKEFDVSSFLLRCCLLYDAPLSCNVLFDSRNGLQSMSPPFHLNPAHLKSTWKLHEMLFSPSHLLTVPLPMISGLAFEMKRRHRTSSRTTGLRPRPSCRFLENHLLFPMTTKHCNQI